MADLPHRWPQLLIPLHWFIQIAKVTQRNIDWHLDSSFWFKNCIKRTDPIQFVFEIGGKYFFCLIIPLPHLIEYIKWVVIINNNIQFLGKTNILYWLHKEVSTASKMRSHSKIIFLRISWTHKSTYGCNYANHNNAYYIIGQDISKKKILWLWRH